MHNNVSGAQWYLHCSSVYDTEQGNKRFLVERTFSRYSPWQMCSLHAAPRTVCYCTAVAAVLLVPSHQASHNNKPVCEPSKAYIAISLCVLTVEPHFPSNCILR